MLNLNGTQLEGMTVKQLREYAAENGIKFNTKVRKLEMIERLVELTAERAQPEPEATPEVKEQAAPAEVETTAKMQKKSGGAIHVGRKVIVEVQEGGTSTMLHPRCGSGVRMVMGSLRQMAPFKEVSMEEAITCKTCINRVEKELEELKAKAEGPTEEELDAVSKQARKVSREVKEAKAPKKSTKKAEPFLPAAPAPTPLKKAEMVEPKKAAKKAEPKPEKKAEPETTKSQKKAETFRRNVEELETGWTTEISDHNETVTEVTAKRGDEVIKIHWEEGRAVNGGQAYTNPLGRTVVLRNASAALQQAGVSEGAALTAAQAKGQSRKGKRGPGTGRPKSAAPAEEIPQEELPFHPEESTAKEIIAAIEGKRISWANSLSGKVQSAVAKPSKKNKVLPGTKSNPSAIIQFMTESGDCSVRISSIKSVR